MRRMPGGRGTPVRSVRIPEDQWQAARRLAKRLGMSVSDLIRETLEHRIAESHDKK